MTTYFHIVKPGDTYDSIAKKYGLKIELIKPGNASSSLTLGTEIPLPSIAKLPITSTSQLHTLAHLRAKPESKQIVEMTLRELRDTSTNQVTIKIPGSPIKSQHIKIGNNTYSSIGLSLDNQKLKNNGIQINKHQYTFLALSEKSDSKKLYFIISSGVAITLDEKKDLTKIWNFISGQERNIYGSTSGTLSLGGYKYSLAQMIKDLDAVRKDLQSRGEYNKLTLREKFLLDLPVVDWKIGWPYASAFMWNWFSNQNHLAPAQDPKSGKILKFGNAHSYLISSGWFQKFYAKSIGEINHGKAWYQSENQNIALRKLYQDLINLSVGTSKSIHVGKDYQNKSSGNSYFASFNVGTTKVLEFLEEDLAGSFGSFSMLCYFNGKATRIDAETINIEFSDIVYRLNDSFDFDQAENFFIENWFGDQPLGVWNNSIFSPEKPKADLFSRNDNITNKDFRELKTHLKNSGNDYSIITNYNPIKTKIRGIELKKLKHLSAIWRGFSKGDHDFNDLWQLNCIRIYT